MKLSANYNYPVAYRLGAGRLDELGAACRELGVTRVLVVTDRGVSSLHWFVQVLHALELVGLAVGVFDDVRSNPVEDDVTSGVLAAHRHRADGIVLVGGGAPLDVGKCIALLARNGGKLFDYEDVGDNWRRAAPDKILPMVAVPTTAGTGSEVGRAAVIKATDGNKKIIFHPKMQPPLVIADPLLTLGLPPAMTAFTGLDAFVHCFEAFCASGFHPMADGIALEGMRLIAENLPVVFQNGSDVEARARMLLASSMGATAFQKGLGVVHALAHPLGGQFDVHHGKINAMLLPYCMRFNEALIASRASTIARHLGLEAPSFTALLDWVLDLRAKLGVPSTLREIPGLSPADFPRLAVDASRDPSLGTNPRVPSLVELEGVLDAAWEGRV